MSDLLPGLFDEEFGLTQPEQTLFDYEQVPVEKRGFVLQKTAETQWLLKRTVADIIKIGENLLEIKAALPHGMYQDCIRSELGMSYENANVFTNIARRLKGKNVENTFLGLGVSLLRELTAPSVPDQVIDQVVGGDIPPTKETIREAIKEAKFEARLAKEAAKKAQADALAYQQRLFNTKDAAQAEIEELTRQMEALKKEMETLTTPQVEIREVEKEVLPQSVKNTLESLQGKITQLNTALEAEKKAIPPDVQKKLDSLQKQADKLKQQEEANRFQQQRIERLNDELRAAVRDSIASENDERIRQDWRTINSEVRSCLMRLLGQWPTPLDVRSFESDDWERLSQLKSTLKRVLEECDNLNYNGESMIVNNTVAETPFAYIEAAKR